MPPAIGRRAVFQGAGLLTATAHAASAQRERPWPSHPVRLVNSGAPGSGIDLLARMLASGLADRLGQSFPVENKPGAGSVLAAQAHAASRPGDSLLLGATGIASTVPLTFNGRLPYDPVADLVPLAIAGSEFLCVAVGAGAATMDLAGLVNEIRARPGSVDWYSVPGFVELNTRLFLKRRGLSASFVAYQGSPAAVLDLVAGRIRFAILPLTPTLGALRDGRLRALAVTSSARPPSLPEVPTVAETGFDELRYDPFTGLFGWRDMPQVARDHVTVAVEAIMSGAATKERLQQAGIGARWGTAAELAEVIAAQRRIMEEAVRTVGVRES